MSADQLGATAPYVSPSRGHAFVPGGQVLSVFEDVDPATVCSVCLLGRPAHDVVAQAAVVLEDEHGTRGVLIGPADRLAEVVRPETVVAPAMTSAQAHEELGWVAREAVRMMRGELTDVEVLEYFTRKAALLEHIASTQVGDERRETHELAVRARAEVAARTAPAPTRGELLGAIADDLDVTTEAWAAAGHPDSGPEFEARELVFVRLRAWNAAG